jgi:hypothetical protein
MSISAPTIWLFAIVEPADPLTIPPLPISIADTRQKARSGDGCCDDKSRPDGRCAQFLGNSYPDEDSLRAG